LGDLSVPLHLRNAPSTLMKELNYGRNYSYSHDNENDLHLQEFMPEELKGNSLYTPRDNKKEKEYRLKIEKIWKGKYS
jgi:putative ATPase